MSDSEIDTRFTIYLFRLYGNNGLYFLYIVHTRTATLRPATLLRQYSFWSSTKVSSEFKNFKSLAYRGEGIRRNDEGMIFKEPGPLEIYDNLRREDKKNPKTFQSFYQDFCLNLKRLIFERLNRNRLPV